MASDAGATVAMAARQMRDAAIGDVIVTEGGEVRGIVTDRDITVRAVAAVGLLVMLGSKVSFFGLGRLPGDIAYKGKHTVFYFPIVTCAILSGVLTLVFWLVAVLTRR